MQEGRQWHVNCHTNRQRMLAALLMQPTMPSKQSEIMRVCRPAAKKEVKFERDMLVGEHMFTCPWMTKINRQSLLYV